MLLPPVATNAVRSTLKICLDKLGIAKYIHYKLSNFMHHLEYEYSGLKLNDMEKMVSEKKILYDHRAKQEEEKYTGSQSLKKINKTNLPTYISENIDKYKEWLD